MDIKKTQKVVLLSALFLSTFATNILAKSHTTGMQNQFFNAKLKPNTYTDKSLFTAFENPPEPMQDDGLKEKDVIHKLPGQPPVSFKQYGGYITINATAGRAFYYYFTESQDPKKTQDLPLLLWLNGGPGCSSLSDGAMQELGPFRVGSDGKTLINNDYAWNHVANVLFLESPAGVGFSYSNTTSDFVKGADNKTAADNYIFLINWLERFQEYKNRDFYMAGESYAGHYVPQLAHNILYHNKKANKTIINLKGILIGNAAINHETDSMGRYDYYASHAHISLETSRKIHKYCDFSPDVEYSNECNNTLNEVQKITENIDIYNIYSPLCFDGNLTSIPKRFSIMESEPCSDFYVHFYLNRPEVQEAIHANITKLHYDWEPCSDVIEEWEGVSTVLPLIKELMENGLRVWIFSGDIDGRLPVTSTQYSLEAMNVTILNPWYPWYRDREVGGYVQEYKDNLTFVTVRGAGHQVPADKPDRALSLVSNFVAGTRLPKK